MFNYYDEIKEKLLKNEIYAKVKDYSKERNKVLTYYEVGKLLSEAGKEYGNDIIGKYADKLAIEVGKKNNQFIIEYCSDERIFAREFKITS